MNFEIDILLARYFSGEAAEKDMVLLNNWLAESEDNEAYFEKMTTIFEKSVMVTPPVFDQKKAFNNFKEYISKEPEKKSRKKYINIYSYIAAAAVIALLVGLFFTREKDNSVTITANKFSQYDLASSGISVTLDSLSNIKYKLENNTYKVAVEGKVSFNVAKNNTNLLVAASETLIKDIGTVFTVISYPGDNEVFVSVESGKVHFYTATNDGLLMDAGTKAVYVINKKEFRIIENKPEPPMVFDFNEQTLNNVISVLSGYFNINIKLTDPNLGSLLITTYFESEPIDEMLIIIAETLSLKLIKEQEAYIISK